MLALLITSHGSSGSCGVNKGTGCSAAPRARNTRRRGSQRPKEKEGGTEMRRQKRQNRSELLLQAKEDKQQQKLVSGRKSEGKETNEQAGALPFSWLENSRLALETLLPMSARERRLDFLVWWRCFRSSVYMTFSFASAFSRPASIWLSVTVSGGTDHQLRLKTEAIV